MPKITNEVLNEKLENLIKTNCKEHKEILEQTTTTNNRVGKLENLKNKIIGGLVVVNIILIPIFLYLLTKFL